MSSSTETNLPVHGSQFAKNVVATFSLPQDDNNGDGGFSNPLSPPRKKLLYTSSEMNKNPFLPSTINGTPLTSILDEDNGTTLSIVDPMKRMTLVGSDCGLSKTSASKDIYTTTIPSSFLSTTNSCSCTTKNKTFSPPITFGYPPSPTTMVTTTSTSTDEEDSKKYKMKKIHPPPPPSPIMTRSKKMQKLSLPPPQPPTYCPQSPLPTTTRKTPPDSPPPPPPKTTMWPQSRKVQCHQIPPRPSSSPPRTPCSRLATTQAEETKNASLSPLTQSKKLRTSALIPTMTQSKKKLRGPPPPPPNTPSCLSPRSSLATPKTKKTKLTHPIIPSRSSPPIPPCIPNIDQDTLSSLLLPPPPSPSKMFLPTKTVWPYERHTTMSTTMSSNFSEKSSTPSMTTSSKKRPADVSSPTIASSTNWPKKHRQIISPTDTLSGLVANEIPPSSYSPPPSKSPTRTQIMSPTDVTLGIVAEINRSSRSTKMKRPLSPPPPSPSTCPPPLSSPSFHLFSPMTLALAKKQRLIINPTYA